MAIEANLHEPAAQLGNKGQLQPVIRELLRLPSLELGGRAPRMETRPRWP